MTSRRRGSARAGAQNVRAWPPVRTSHAATGNTRTCSGSIPSRGGGVPECACAFSKRHTTISRDVHVRTVRVPWGHLTQCELARHLHSVHTTAHPVEASLSGSVASRAGFQQPCPPACGETVRLEGERSGPRANTETHTMRQPSAGACRCHFASPTTTAARSGAHQ